MKNTYRILIAGLLFLVLFEPVKGQISNDEMLNRARALLYDYRDASLFRDLNTGGYDPSWEGIFRNCFDGNVGMIVFDIPFRVQSSDNSSENQITEIYQEMVTIDDYILNIRSAYEIFNLTGFSFNLVEMGVDTTNLHSTKKLLFEVRKSFTNTRWSVGASGNYIIEIRFIGDQPKISALRLVDENIARSNVSLTFVNSNLQQNDPEFYLKDVVGQIRIEYDEMISNRKMVVMTDTSGRIALGLIPNRALLMLDSVTDIGGNKYSVPPDWRLIGKKVNSQPLNGFVVPLRSWKWNGFSWSVRGFGGLVHQSGNQLSNFSSGSNFDNQAGFKYGFGVEMVKHFSLKQISNLFSNDPATVKPEILAFRRSTYVGVGLGISYYHYQYKISGNEFVQNPYQYSDRMGTPVQVLVSGSGFNETTSGSGVLLPIFAEFRKVLVNKINLLQAWSFQTGVNLIIPVETKHEISGEFSRYGLYEQFNSKPVTDDPFYNYYSNVEKGMSETSQNIISPALMFRLSGYLDIFGEKSDNLLDVGLLLSFPMKIRTPEETAGYYLATGNDDFSSMSNSKSKVYDYFIGLSIGYNFINYRVY